MLIKVVAPTAMAIALHVLDQLATVILVRELLHISNLLQKRAVQLVLAIIIQQGTTVEFVMPHARIVMDLI